MWGGGVSEIFLKVQIFGTRLDELTGRGVCEMNDSIQKESMIQKQLAVFCPL